MAKKHVFENDVPRQEHYGHGLEYETNAQPITGGRNEFKSFPAVDAEGKGDKESGFCFESHTNGKKGK